MTTRRVQVRMYNVGFGDCFLVHFSGPEGSCCVLIDCGMHSASRGKVDLDQIVAAVQADLAQEGKAPGVDVVIATHRHRDHVHGFGRDGWDAIAVREVWMPWTEDPDDPTARRIRERQSALAVALTEAASASGRLSLLHHFALNSLTNERAMATLHSGFAGEPRRWFLPTLPAQERDFTFQTPTLPGVTMHVLGPGRDERTIRDLEPPATGSYLRSDSPRHLVPGGSPLPFGSWRLVQREYKRRFGHLDLRNLGDVVNAAKDDPYQLSVALEKAVNGTSLMLMFQFGRAYLLFPGDAQWGTWDRALSDPKSRQLLAKSTFYKVGHHGSRNATPREFVDELLHGADVAMVSVAPTRISSWKDIPRQPLLDALAEPGRCALVIRSDQAAPNDPIVHADSNRRWVEVDLPA